MYDYRDPKKSLRVWAIITAVTTVAVVSAFVISGLRDKHDHKKETYVWICTGPMSKRYHSDGDCIGLRSCSDNVTYIPLSDAKKMGRTECSYCYGD